MLPTMHYEPFWKRNLHTPRDNCYLYAKLDTRLMEIILLQIENPDKYNQINA